MKNNVLVLIKHFSQKIWKNVKFQCHFVDIENEILYKLVFTKHTLLVLLKQNTFHWGNL